MTRLALQGMAHDLFFTVPEKCDQQCSEETSASNVKNGLNTASQEMPGKTLVQISDYTSMCNSCHHQPFPMLCLYG